MREPIQIFIFNIYELINVINLFSYTRGVMPETYVVYTTQPLRTLVGDRSPGRILRSVQCLFYFREIFPSYFLFRKVKQNNSQSTVVGTTN